MDKKIWVDEEGGGKGKGGAGQEAAIFKPTQEGKTSPTCSYFFSSNSNSLTRSIFSSDPNQIWRLKSTHTLEICKGIHQRKQKEGKKKEIKYYVPFFSSQYIQDEKFKKPFKGGVYTHKNQYKMRSLLKKSGFPSPTKKRRPQHGLKGVC